MQNSHILLSKLFRERKIFDTKKLFLIDVHTGLGPEGMDTLMSTSLESVQILKGLYSRYKDIFPAPYSIEGMDAANGNDDGASQGYGKSTIIVCRPSNIKHFFRFA